MQALLKWTLLVTNFDVSKDENHKHLGEVLSKQTSFIIKNCSMKGEAHDQLHIVLVPMLDEISTLRDTEDIGIKKAALTRLQIYIKKYFEHFKNE